MWPVETTPPFRRLHCRWSPHQPDPPAHLPGRTIVRRRLSFWTDTRTLETRFRSRFGRTPSGRFPMHQRTKKRRDGVRPGRLPQNRKDVKLPGDFNESPPGTHVRLFTLDTLTKNPSDDPWFQTWEKKKIGKWPALRRGGNRTLLPSSMGAASPQPCVGTRSRTCHNASSKKQAVNH